MGNFSEQVWGLSGERHHAYLDANYLRQEKRYRCLYRAVAEGDPDIEAFTLSTKSLPARFTCDETGGWKNAPERLEKLLPGPSVWRSPPCQRGVRPLG